MALFSRTPAPLPGPGAPLAEHLDAIERGQDGSVEALVQAMASRQLWVGVQSLPPELHGRVFTLASELVVPMMTSTLPDGGSALLVFSDQEQVHLRAPQVVPLGVEGRVLLERVAEGYDGLVLNPGSRFQALTSDWVKAGLAQA